MWPTNNFSPPLMHNIHDDLLHFFINPMVFTIERISNLNISRYCCEVSFWSKCWAKSTAKVSEFYRTILFDPHLGSGLPFTFWVCFEYFQNELKETVFASPCKLHNMLYIHLRRYMFILTWSWNYNYIHDLENILTWFLF